MEQIMKSFQEFTEQPLNEYDELASYKRSVEQYIYLIEKIIGTKLTSSFSGTNYNNINAELHEEYNKIFKLTPDDANFTLISQKAYKDALQQVTKNINNALKI
jgi:hypothetical protein